MALLYYGQSTYGTPTYFRLFTKESLTKIDRRIQDEKSARDLARELARERMELEGVQVDKKPADEDKLKEGLKALARQLPPRSAMASRPVRRKSLAGHFTNP